MLFWKSHKKTGPQTMSDEPEKKPLREARRQEWAEFLPKHNRPRGEMDAGLLFGSDAAPRRRLRELMQVVSRLNLMRVESVFVSGRPSGSNALFFAEDHALMFCLPQLVPSIKKIYGTSEPMFCEKFPDVEFTSCHPKSDIDCLWINKNFVHPSEARLVPKGGVVVVEGVCQRKRADLFSSILFLGNESEVVLDHLERDAIEALQIGGKEVPDTKYCKFLMGDPRKDCGGFGMIYV